MSKHQPPRLARKIFEWYCGSAKVEDLVGDIDEWFYKTLESHSLFRAKYKYWTQVLSLLFSYAIKKRKMSSANGRFSSNVFSLSMLNNYLKVSVRSLYKQKYFSIVNALGLAIGMSIGLLLIAMYSYVLSYDNFHPNRDNIFRIISNRVEGVDENEMASVPSPLAEMLKAEFPAVEKSVRILSEFSNEVVLEKQSIHIDGYYAEQGFLSLFNFPLMSGDSLTALRKPNSLVLTETTAKKLFNKSDVVGNLVEIKGTGSFEITGVLHDLPKNTHFEFEVLVSYSSLPASMSEPSNKEAWSDYWNNYLYVQLPDNFNRTLLEQALDKIATKAYMNDDNVRATFALQALYEINPGPDLSNSPGPKWDNLGFIIFGTISLLILLPACFNYTNISVARALKRSKEIGLRKTMGGLKNHIFFQFITETIIITLISLLSAVLLFVLVRPEFQSMLVEASSLDLSLTWEMASLFLLFALITGLLAGFFPALYFAGLNPIQAMKSQSGSKRLSGMRIRKGLTIFQFVLSFGFILALVVFSRQYRYSLNFEFGFQKENILDVELQGIDPNTFKSVYGKLSSVHNISMSSNILGIGYSASMVHAPGKADSTETFQLFADEQYVHNMGLKLLAGKNFPDAVWQREQHMLVNEEFLKTHNIPNPVDAIGQVFTVDGQDLEVIGVLKNFHFASLREPIKSFILRMNPNHFHYANMKVSFTDVYGTMNGMEKLWKTLSDRYPFRAQFFDDEIEAAYDFYHSLLKIIGFLGLLAISISLLGMLGMVVYTSEQRTKEVGIRKVLGASVKGITFLLSKDYLKLMGWAFIIGTPLAVLIIDWMLSTMQHYSVQLTVWDILAGMAILVVMSLLTISSQTIKIASTNPAETLKCE